MSASDAPFLDVLAACLGASVPLPDALARIETAGADAARWVVRIRPFVRADSSVENALFAARAIDAEEHALLALAVTPHAVENLLHTLALRRQRRASLGRMILRGLVGPFSVAALTVVLDPLPNLIGGGSYVGPVFVGLLVLGLASALVTLAIPAALRSAAIRPRVLAVCARFPLADRLAARHAEAELVTLAATFAGGAENAGLQATSALLRWSPLAERIRTAALASTTMRDLALVRLAPYLSLTTNLSIVSGIASGQLPARLAARGDEMAADLSARLRFLLRVTSYTLVVILTLSSLAGLVSRALPGMPMLPGVTPTTEQKELDEIMKELEGPAPSPPPK